MPVDKPEDVAVAVGQLDGADCGRALEPGKTGGIHPDTIRDTEPAAEASGFAGGGKGRVRSQEFGLRKRGR